MLFLITFVAITMAVVKACEYTSNWNTSQINRECVSFEQECMTYNLTEAAINVSRERLKCMERHTDLFNYTKEV